MFDFVNRLLKVEADLVVTITAPLDPRLPGNDKDRIRLRNLLADARAQVLERFDSRPAKPLLDRLEQVSSEIDITGGDKGVAIVAWADGAESHLLPFPVAEGLTLATTPATRTLIQGIRRSPRSRLLEVSDTTVRLYEGVRSELVEVTEHGFPFETELIQRDNRAIAGRFARKPAGDDLEAWRKFYREVDHALATIEAADPLPLVVAGVRRSLDLFDDVSTMTEHVVGRLEGSYERTDQTDLGNEAWQIHRQRLRDRRAEVIEEVASGVGTGQAVSGMDEVWQLTREGRGRLLVLEEDYQHRPSVEVDGRLVLADGELGPDVMTDPVDELVEHAVRAGGGVEFVSSGALSDYGRVGLLLRGSLTG